MGQGKPGMTATDCRRTVLSAKVTRSSTSPDGAYGSPLAIATAGPFHGVIRWRAAEISTPESHSALGHRCPRGPQCSLLLARGRLRGGEGLREQLLGDPGRLRRPGHLVSRPQPWTVLSEMSRQATIVASVGGEPSRPGLRTRC